MRINTDRLKAVILAAGMGSRLGQSWPKPLTKLKNGRSILQQQLENISHYLNEKEVIIVVGYKKEMIIQAFPDNLFVYNERYNMTNTAKSLLKALNKCQHHDVLWINGDVVFQNEIIKKLLEKGSNAIAVTLGEVDEEAVKYRTDRKGKIIELSKEVSDARGEAIGINLIKRQDLNLLIKSLEQCNDQDFFEKGIEISIKRGLTIYPVDITEYKCIEVDFVEDLNKANEFFTV